MKLKVKIFALCILFALTACSDKDKIVNLSTNDTDAARLQWYRDAKFGIMIHWDPISQLGLEISWSRKCSYNLLDSSVAYHCRTILPEVYDSLYKTFNPTEFNANEWASIFTAAGAKYIVFVTKHHDGFCMFDTKYTNYKITGENCPFKRDVVAELSNAIHATNLRLGLYYSKPDWINPYVNTSLHSKFVSYALAQLRELCTNYGQIDLFFFDGGNPPEFMNSDSAYKIIKNYHPQAIINNRLWNDGRGDYLTPEGYLYQFCRYQLWETNIPIGCSWSWRPNDPYERSAERILTELRYVVGEDGNYLLGIGPMPNGQIAQRHIDKLKFIGAWLSKNGESIYGTRGGPYMPINQNIVSTCKQNKIYIHILDWNVVSSNIIVLKQLPSTITNAYILNSKAAVAFSNSSNGLILDISKIDKTIDNSVIVLETNTPNTFSIRPL